MRDAGTSVAWMASRFVHSGVPASPGIGGIDRVGAGVQHDRAARLELAVTDGDRLRPGQPAVAANEPAAFALEAIDGDLVVPVVGGLVADSRGDRCPIGHDPRVAGKPRNPASFREGVCGADHHLARDAAKVRTLAADQPLIDANHVEVRLCQPPGEVLPAWAHPDDDDVHLLHGCLPAVVIEAFK